MSRVVYADAKTGHHPSMKTSGSCGALVGWVVVLALGACGGDETTASSDTAGGSSTGTTTGTTTSTTTGAPTTDAPTTTTDAPTTPTTPTSDSTTTTDASSSSTDGSTGGSSSTTMPPATCGDGAVDPGEECDDANDIDTDMCTGACLLAFCGDGLLHVGVEACEGVELDGQSCAGLGFDAGELACQGTCEFDTSACSACGNGMLEAGETCDDGNKNDDDGCSATCMTEPCDPDGVYMIQGPPVAYTCCLGLTTVNITGFSLTADGATITSSPSNPVPMIGQATTCPDGDFSNQGVIPGGCAETYAVSGSFSDKDTWVGSYSLNFVGADCTCFNGQLGTPCVNQMFPITAKR